MPDLRQRKNATMGTQIGNESENCDSDGMQFDSMMNASPQHAGHLQKLRVSPLFLMLPSFVKKWIMKWGCLIMARPTWKTRSLVLLGTYLYKFDSDGGRHVGTPLEVLDMDSSLLESSDAEYLGMSECISLLPSSSVVIRISIPRKTYHYACSSKEEALVWVRSLQNAKQEGIRRAMGHADVGSYPRSWEYFDALGKKAALTKARIRQRMENNTLRELEMSSIMDSGPLPRGYFG